MARSRSLADLGNGQATFKIGDVIWSSLAAAPTAWLSCNGGAVSRTTYAALFAAIGTTYGAGDGTATFNLPDTRGRALVGVGTGTGLTARARGDTGGAETHTLTESQMPLHGHPFQANYVAGGSSQLTGGIIVNPNTNSATQAAYTGAPSNTAGQQIGGTGGGAAHNNMQPFLALNAFIYAGV